MPADSLTASLTAIIATVVFLGYLQIKPEELLRKFVLLIPFSQPKSIK